MLSLHVLTLTPFFPSEQNEIRGCFVSEPIDELKRLGIRSTVIAVSPLHHARNHPSSRAPAEWVRYPQIPGNFGLSSAGRSLYHRLLSRVGQEHKRNRVDLIHAHAALPCGHAAMLLSRRFKIPFVVTVHGLDVFNNCHRSGAPAAWRREISSDVYRAARYVICVSGKVQEILGAGMPVEVNGALVYNGANPELFFPSPANVPGPDPEILVVGTLQESKGHALVLRALAALKSQFPSLHCSIVGEGPERADFVALTRKLGIERQVRFVGRLTRREVAAAMQHCSVFVLPSRDEGLGCVYLEAMSCGKPVIGCQGQGIEEIIEPSKNGYLIPPHGLPELVECLATLFHSPAVSTQIGTAARQTILERLTLRHQAQNLISIYRQAIA